ncbi:hypothetical protein LXN10_01775 [Arcobacter sp. KX21116]|uniref:hypothetical protein n=1 Tax=Arcobacter iocasae TaxID=2906515 RepID=UPI0035D413AC
MFNKVNEYNELIKKLDDTNVILNDMFSVMKENQNQFKNEINEKIDLMLTRFFKLFELHDIHINEIPIVIDKKFNITYYDISSKEKLLKKISHELLEWVASFFSININWLVGENDYMYETHHFDKDIFGFCKMINSISKEYDIYDIHLLKDFELDVNIDENNNTRQYVYPICQIKILELNGKYIYKYIVFEDYHWDYKRTRIELKVMVYLIYKKYVDYYKSNVYIKGYDIGKDMDYYSFIKGETSYNQLHCFGYSWYPEDYVDDPLDSYVAKDTEERQEVLEYIEYWKLLENLNEDLEYYSLNSNNLNSTKNKKKDINLHEIDKNPEKIVLLVEGETDKLHLEKAFEVLYDKPHNFTIIHFDGVIKLERSLINSTEIFSKHISNNPIIAIFDADDTGLKSFEKVVKNKIDNNIGIIKSLNNLYAITLPLPQKDLKGICEIEYLYPKEFLHQNEILKYADNRRIIELAENNINEISKVFQDIEANKKLKNIKYYKIDENLKTNFAKSIFDRENLDKSIFESFHPLFELIDKIFRNRKN